MDKEDTSDISAAQLAAIQSKGQFNRSISLALSSKTCGESEPSSGSAPAEQHGASQSLDVSGISEGQDQEEEEDLSSSDGVSTAESSPSSSDEEDSATGQASPLPQPSASCRRRRTRLQRHTLRQYQREFLAPFTNDDDFGLPCPVEAEDRVQRVPTLMELCMRRGFSQSGTVPPGLRPALSQHHSKARLATLQLRWLGRNLELLEKQIKWNLVEAVGLHGVKSTHLRRDARSLWRRDWCPYDSTPHPETVLWIVPLDCRVYDGAEWKIAALAHYINLTLPHLSSDSGGALQTDRSKGCVDRDVQQLKRCLKKRYPKMVKYCFDHAMAYVWWARGRCNRAQETFLKVAKQYPTDKPSETEHKTLWARHRAMVLLEIGRLLVTFDLPDSAGHFYREAAELAGKELHPNEVDRLTLQSLALTASAHDQGVMERRTAAQASSLWAVTARHALALPPAPPTSLWDHSWVERGEQVQEEQVTEAVLAAVESLLHCHAGQLTDQDSQAFRNASHRNRVWLTGARAYLEKLQSQQTAFVGLYLSFVLAMLNEGIATEDAYHFSLRSTVWSGHPGEVSRMLTEDDIRLHPWWLFMEWITARTAAMGKMISEPLRVLPLVWRRGLQQPQYRSSRDNCGVPRKQVAEIQSVTPDLRVTPKGHLTGAMVQNLPPRTKVCFDAHSGQVYLGDSCCDELHRWDNYGTADRIRGTSHFDCNSSLPQPNVIYTDPRTSTTVSILVNSLSSYYELEADRHPVYIRKKASTWRTAENSKLIQRVTQPAISVVYRSTGTKVSINVVDTILQDQKKQLLDSFTNEYQGLPNISEVKKDVEGMMDYFISRSYDCTPEILKRFVQSRSRGTPSQKSVAHHCPASRQDFQLLYQKNLHLFRTVTMRVKKVLYVGKATIVLLLQMRRFAVFLFLDCTSAASFSHPILRRSKEGYQRNYFGSDRPSGWMLPSECCCWNAPNPTASLLFAFTDFENVDSVSCTHLKMQVFDERGNVQNFEKFEHRKELQANNKLRYFTACEGHKIIGIGKEKTKVTVCDFETQRENWSTEFARISVMEVAKGTVYVSTIEGVYALDLNSLEPLVIVHLNSSGFVAPSNDNGLLLYVHTVSADFLKVLGTKEVMAKSDGTEQYNGTFLGMENHILLVRRRKIDEGELLEGEQVPNVLEVRDVMLPGRPTELCYLSEQAGFVVSATIFVEEAQSYYRENLYWFDMAGDIIAIHPFIGGGRHGFLPVYLRDPKDDGKANDDKEGEVLHLYFADGLGALCCIKLDILEYR